MLLTQEHLCYYLLERKTIEEKVLVDGDYMVLPISGSRNNLFKVLCKSRKSLFIKQTSKFDAVTTSVLTREANTYRFLSQGSMYPKVASGLPTFFDYDRQRHTLTVEYFPGAQSIHEYFVKQKSYFPELAVQQAVLLHSYHTPIPEGTDTSIFPKTLPWALQIFDFPPGQMFPGSKANEELMSMVYGNTELKGHFDQLKADYKMTTLIHGDIKWMNFIIYPAADGMKQSLIDWELADIGDPAWDVAGLIQSYISTWVFSFDNADPRSKDLKENMKGFDITNMQASINSFWKTYAALMQHDSATATASLYKCLRFAAARIVQTSIEGVVYNPQIYPNNVRSLQLAFNILKSPQNAAKDLLGIKL